MITIDVKTARAGLVAACKLRGYDYVYTDHYDNCYYAVLGEPGCIVGCAIDSIDHELFALLMLEEAEQHEREDGLPVSSIRKAFAMDTMARAGLEQAQQRQDKGGTWGDALRDFDDTVTTLTNLTI